MEIEINGIKYRKRYRTKPSGSKGMFTLMAATMAIAGGLPSIGGSDRKRPAVDIVEEFKLIQAKKSKLCRNDRDWVERVFKYDYEIVNELKDH